jgi:sugar phosphate isomerase/epimerase
MMKVSINTAVFLDEMQNGVSQYECLQKLVGKPIQDIEVRGEFLKDDTRDEELKNISTLCDSNDWKFYFSIPEELFTEDVLNENIFNYLKMAEKFGIRGLKISLGSFKSLDNPQVEKLIDVLQTTTVKVTVENQPNQNGVLKTFTQNLKVILDIIPELGYTFDSGNWYWISEKPEKAFEALKEYITVFHLKDIKDQDTVMLGEGLTNWVKLVRQLNAEVPVFLEYGINEQRLENEIEKVNLELI